MRSAEPPTVAAQFELIASSAASEALRVATEGFSALVFFLASLSAWKTASGASQSIAASKSFVRRLPQASRAALPLAPMARQSERISSGISKAGDGQCSSLRAPATSSAPGASLCAFCVPWRLGMPKPMMVLQAMRTGLSLFCAQCSARETSAASWPSTWTVFQPADWKRSIVSVLSASEVAPSMVMELSSNSTIRRLSRRCPASVIASWLMPSIRSPSLAMT